MAVQYPSYNFLVEWAIDQRQALDPTNAEDADEIKDSLNALARTYYAATFPLRYPNTVDAMLYAYLLSLWATAHP